MKAFWIKAFERKRIQPYRVEILLKACEAHDQLSRPAVFSKKKSSPTRIASAARSRPEVQIERNNRWQFAKLLDQADLFDPYF